jgi:hypothetical protein
MDRVKINFGGFALTKMNFQVVGSGAVFATRNTQTAQKSKVLRRNRFVIHE